MVLSALLGHGTPPACWGLRAAVRRARADKFPDAGHYGPPPQDVKGENSANGRRQDAKKAKGARKRGTKFLLGVPGPLGALARNLSASSNEPDRRSRQTKRGSRFRHRAGRDAEVVEVGR